MEFPYSEKPYTQRSWYFIFFTVFLLISFFVGGMFLIQRTLNNPPYDFPIQTEITIQENASVNEITNIFKSAHAVKSSFYLKLVLRYMYPTQYIQAGTYRFETPQSSYAIAKSITRGENMLPLVKLFLPEGFRTKDLYKYLPASVISTTTHDVSMLEGYLFPDTYFISSNATLSDILVLLQDTHKMKIAQFSDQIDRSSLSESEVIILASILEREANSAESKKIVSGILQNRLAIEMPLQVDAVFDYILNKTSKELTEEDLRMDSPYNTYTNVGLPPTPISNPGAEAIEAVLNPTETEYLYYITGDDGNFYYAKTFEEHKRNKAKYIMQ